MHFQHRKSPKEHVKEHVFFLGGKLGGGGLLQKFYDRVVRAEP